MFVHGDWHGNATWASYMLQGLPGIHVHVGDFGVWPGDKGKRYIDTVAKTLHRNATMLIVPGNHEDYNQIDALPDGNPHLPGSVENAEGFKQLRDNLWIAYQRPSHATVEGLDCQFFGGAVSIDQLLRKENETWWRQEAFTREECLRMTGCEVLFTHDVPAGVLPYTNEFAASWFTPDIRVQAMQSRAWLREGVDQAKPEWLFHGHWHYSHETLLEGYDYTTKVVGLDMDGSPNSRGVFDGKTFTWKNMRRRVR